ncbi:hypothetical protein [Geodermatophilus sp. SYSU D00684]
MTGAVDVVLTAPAPLVPPVGLSSGPLGAVQAADREIARQTALRARAVAAFAAALVEALGVYADALPDDGRTRGQRMADCLLDLVLRPGEHGLPPVQVRLDVVAPLGALLGGDQPCEIDGQVVPAEVARALLTALTGAPLVSTVDSDPAGRAPGDTSSAGTSAAGTTAADTAPTGSASSAGPIDAETEAAPIAQAPPPARDTGDGRPDPDFVQWWTDTVRRVLVEELAGGQPALVGLAEVQARWAAEEGPPEPGPPPDDRSAPGEAPDGWWARADRAVDDAGDALLTAERALGHARRMVAAAERAATADEAAWGAGPAGRVTAAGDALTALAAATDTAREALAGLLRRTAGGGLADRPRLVLTDALTGALLTLTDLPALHRANEVGTGPGVPGPSAGYHPDAALDRHGHARDRRCRFPGCRRRTGHLDQHTPWPTGPTAAPDLAGYCAGHHRGKHQVPGRRHHLAPDGTLTVTTPAGLTATTTPPPC